jgi:hypothetical protein
MSDSTSSRASLSRSLPIDLPAAANGSDETGSGNDSRQHSQLLYICLAKAACKWRASAIHAASNIKLEIYCPCMLSLAATEQPQRVETLT